MKENNDGVEEGFYQAVGKILNCDPCYKKREFRKITRWNNRTPGNGRYPGHGIVRFYSSTNIHVSLHTPYITGVYNTIEDALNAIKE